MSNWIDRVDEWAHQKKRESFGEYYVRCLLTVLYMGFAVGLLAGLVLGVMAGDYAVHHIK